METRGATGPILRRGTVRGRWPGEGKAWPVGPGYSVSPAQLRITTRVLLCCSKSGYPCCRVPTVTIRPSNFLVVAGTFPEQVRRHFAEEAPDQQGTLMSCAS